MGITAVGTKRADAFDRCGQPAENLTDIIREAPPLWENRWRCTALFIREGACGAGSGQMEHDAPSTSPATQMA
jgi:hypothetical protein